MSKYNADTYTQYLRFLDSLRDSKDTTAFFNQMSYEEFCTSKGLVQFISDSESADFRSYLENPENSSLKDQLKGALSADTDLNKFKGFLGSSDYSDFMMHVNAHANDVGFAFKKLAVDMTKPRTMISKIAASMVVGFVVRAAVNALPIAAIAGSTVATFAAPVIIGAAMGGIMSYANMDKNLSTREKAEKVVLGMAMGMLGGALSFGVSELVGQIMAPHADALAPSADAGNVGNTTFSSDNSTMNAGNSTLNVGNSTVTIEGQTDLGSSAGQTATDAAASTTQSAHPCMIIRGHEVTVEQYLEYYNKTAPGLGISYSQISPHDINAKAALESFGLDPCKVHVCGQDLYDALKISADQNDGVYLTRDCTELHHTAKRIALSYS
ncbi:MAG: hypothetical protein WC464_05090 [Bdellovibrionales bacterium]